MSAVSGAPGREPTFWDYVKAAFHLRVPVPGLGGVPINWLYLLGVAVAGIPIHPLWLLGLAGEIALLAYTSSNPRFQRAVRARMKQSLGRAEESRLGSLAQSLSQGSRQRAESFERQCGEILEIARKAGAVCDDIETYAVHLTQLREVYVRMLGLAELLAVYSRDWKASDPLPQIGALKKELERDGLSDAMRRSREATLQILEKRARSREALSERGQLVQSEIARLEQQVALLRDQALLTRDPSVLTTNMDAAAGILEEHTSWLQENSALLQEFEQQQQQA